MGRRTDSTAGAHSRADAAPATTHDREVTTDGTRTTADGNRRGADNHRRAQGHAPAGGPPFRIGDWVRHRRWGLGIVRLPNPERDSLGAWWVHVDFAFGPGEHAHRTWCMASTLEATA